MVISSQIFLSETRPTAHPGLDYEDRFNGFELKKGIRLALSLRNETIRNDKYRSDFKDAGAFLWARLAECLARLAHVLLYPPGG